MTDSASMSFEAARLHIENMRVQAMRRADNERANAVEMHDAGNDELLGVLQRAVARESALTSTIRAEQYDRRAAALAVALTLFDRFTPNAPEANEGDA